MQNTKHNVRGISRDVMKVFVSYLINWVFVTEPNVQTSTRNVRDSLNYWLDKTSELKTSAWTAGNCDEHISLFCHILKTFKTL